MSLEQTYAEIRVAMQFAKAEQKQRRISAIVTTLDSPVGDWVREIWQALRTACQITHKLAINPIPHFSYHGAESYLETELGQVLTTVAGNFSPFLVRTNGVGIFTGASRVVYLPLVKTRQLCELHEMIWQNVQELGYRFNSHYHPEVWMPHITLAVDPMENTSLECVGRRLLFQKFDWEISVDHLALIHAGPGTEVWEGNRYRFNSRQAVNKV
jgi:2'-5' RNA ligase